MCIVYGKAVRVWGSTPLYWALSTWLGLRADAATSLKEEVSLQHTFMQDSHRVQCFEVFCVFCRERGHGDGGGPWEAGGVYRTAVSVSAGHSLSARRHAALAGEHGPETHLSYSVHSSQHTQHCLWEVQEEALPQIELVWVCMECIRAWTVFQWHWFRRFFP